jgi:hypothetical protein
MSLSFIATKAVDDILSDDEFWREIERIFAVGTSAVTRRIFHAGAEYARSAGVMADFDTVNLAALRVTRETSSRYWRLMTQTTRDGLREALTTWQAEGLGKRGLPDLVDSLEPLFGQERAKRVAVTETTRVFAEGNREAMAQDDTVGGEIWSTAEDELVCSRCGPLNEKIYPKGQGPAQPLHVNCLPGDARVTAEGIAATSKRWYDGDLVVIRTAAGKQLACTPNHPILTPSGWVPASLLDTGGYVISSSLSQWTASAGLAHLDDQNMPACIEDIAKAFRCDDQMAAVPVPLTAEDFHGDGVGSKVAVVRANRLLWHSGNTAFREHFGQAGFRRGSMPLPLLIGNSSLDSFRQTDRSTARGCVSRLNLAALLDVAHLQPLQALGFALATYDQPRFSYARPNNRAGNAVALSQTILGFSSSICGGQIAYRQRDTLAGHSIRISTLDSETEPFEAPSDGALADAALALQICAGAAGPIFADEVVNIQRNLFRGHVYNLQTASGWYVAGGIITHNCRCAYLPATWRYIRQHRSQWQGGALPAREAD